MLLAISLISSYRREFSFSLMKREFFCLSTIDLLMLTKNEITA